MSFLLCWFVEIDIMINTDSRGHLHSNDRGEILVLKTTTAKAFAKNVFINQE